MKKIIHKLFIILLFVFTTSNTFALKYYWQGNGGSWSDLSHWYDQATGGTQYAVVPGLSDTTYFGASSFTSGGQTVTLSGGGGIQLKAMDWTGVTNNPTFDVSSPISFLGYLKLVAGVTLSQNDILTFAGSGVNSITTGGNNMGQIRVLTSASTDVYNMLDNYAGIGLFVYIGTLNTNNHIVTLSGGPEDSYIWMNDVGATFNFGSSIVTCAALRFQAGTINPGTSTLILNGNHTMGGNAPTEYQAYNESNTVVTLYNLTVTGNSIDYFGMWGAFDIANNFTVDYGTLVTSAASETITAANIILTKSCNWFIEPTTTIEIANTFTNTGVGCNNFTNILSTTLPSTAKLRKTSGTITVANAAIQGIEAMGGATFNVTGTDLGFNTGFTFISPGASLNYYWWGGTGNMNDAAHWSLLNGSYSNPGGCLPTIKDNVFFNASSGTGIVTATTHFACKNMDWTGSTILTFDANAATIKKQLLINGSLKLLTGLTWSGTQDMYLLSSVAAEPLRTNNVVLGNIIHIRATGGYTNTDALLNSTIINFYAGTWNTNNQNIECYGLVSDQIGTRTLTLGSSEIKLVNANFNNTINTNNLTLNAGTSVIKLEDVSAAAATVNNGYLLITGPTRTFYDINFALNALGKNSELILNTGPQNFHDISFTSDGYIHGGDMNLHDLNLSSGMTMLFEQNNTHTFTGNINTPAGCGSVINITCYPSGGGRVNFVKTAGAITINNCIVSRTETSGGATFTANGSLNDGNNIGWTFIPPAAGTTYYWIGGTGNWSDCTHWSLTSGVANNPSCCLPSVNDNVTFNASSFSATGQTVYLDVSAYFNTMDWSGSNAWSPVFESVGYPAMNVFGSFILNSSMDISNITGDLFFKGARTATINFSGHDYTNNYQHGIAFYNSGVRNLASDITSRAVHFYGGTLNTNNYDVTTQLWYVHGNDTAMTFNLGSSIIDTEYGWNMENPNDNVTLNAGTSSIYTNVLYCFSPLTTHQYYNVYVKYYSPYNNAIFIGYLMAGINVHKLQALNGCNLEIYGSNTFDTLSLYPATINYFEDGSTQTINQKLIAKGNPCYRIQLRSMYLAGNAMISQATGSVITEYSSITKLSGIGGAQFYASSNSLDGGSNTGWTFSNLSSSTYGFGARTQTIACASYPYTLTTDGFNGGVDWLWNTGATTSSILLADTGTFSVRVDLGGACYAYDTVTLHKGTCGSPLPIELIAFEAEKQQKKVRLFWSTATEINNHYFDVEKSADGLNFKTIASVPGAGNSTEILNYTCFDESPNTGINYYRLKQIDYDGRMNYTNIRAVSYEEKSSSMSLIVKPNPATFNSNVVLTIDNLKSGTDVYISAINNLGQEVYQGIHYNNDQATHLEHTIKLEDVFRSGIYLISVKTEYETITQKIIIQ